jgi:hypothetical protein
LLGALAVSSWHCRSAQVDLVGDDWIPAPRADRSESTGRRPGPQFIAYADTAPLDGGFWERDLEFAGHLGHVSMMGCGKDYVKACALIQP